MEIAQKLLGKIKQALEHGIPFVHRTGIEVLELGPGHVRMRLPFEPNVNHVGTMYAGALYTLAELPGGAIFMTSFDAKRYYPIVKDMHIRFRRPAKTDVTVTVDFDLTEAARIQERADRDGKADYEWECALQDASGEVVATSRNVYQLRAFGR
jgi:thioesterase domain-containing protein